MPNKNTYLGSKRLHERDKEYIECQKCIFEYNCPCLWSWLSDTCVKIAKEVKYEADSSR